MANPLSIADLRASLGLSQSAFARRIGLENKASVSLIERGLRQPTSDQALAIERISGGRIDAADLNSVVALARGAGGSAAQENPAGCNPSPAGTKAGKGGCAQLSALPGGGA